MKIQSSRRQRRLHQGNEASTIAERHAQHAELMQAMKARGMSQSEAIIKVNRMIQRMK